ncbi:unnamed protein product [Absidia cylindrospora]
MGDTADHAFDDDENYVPYVPVKQRRLEKMHKYATQKRTAEPTPDEQDDEETAAQARNNMSLLDQIVEQKKLNLYLKKPKKKNGLKKNDKSKKLRQGTKR